MTDPVNGGPLQIPDVRRMVPTPTPFRQSAGPGDTFSAAFETSFLGSAWRWMNQSKPAADPAFVFGDAMKRPENEWLRPYVGFMAEAESQEEFDMKAAYLRRQHENKEILSETGMTGMIAAMVADIPNPANLIYPHGYIMGGASALARVGRSAQVGAGLGAGAMGLQAAVDPTVSTSEVALGAAVGAGALGAFRGAGETIAAARRMMFPHVDPGDPRFATINGDDGYRPQGLSADATQWRSQEGMEAPLRTGTGIETLGTSPFMRAINSGVAEVSEFAQSLFPPSMALAKNAEGIAGDTSIWTSIKLNWETGLYSIIRGMDEDFAAYRGRPGKTDWLSRSTVSLSDGIRQPTGVLTREAYSDRVWDQLSSRAFDDPVAEVNATARRFAAFYDERAKELVDLGFFQELKPKEYELLSGRIVEHYAGTRVWNKGTLKSDKQGFLDDWESYKANLPPDHPYKKMTGEQAYQAVMQDQEFVPLTADVTGRASSLRQRGLDVPSAMFKRWLLTDVDTLARFYARTVGTDVEIGRRFRAGGKPDITMREGITQSMRGYVAKLDDLIDLKTGQSGKVNPATGYVEGVAGSAFTTMRGLIDTATSRTQKLYAKAAEIFESGGDVTDLDLKVPANKEAADLANRFAKSDEFYTDLSQHLRERLEDEIEAARQGFASRVTAAAGGDSQAEKLVTRMFAAERDMEDLRDALRGTLGQSRDPLAWTSRSIRLAKEFTNMTVLTGVTSAMSDFGNAVMRFGMARTFGTLFQELTNKMAGVKAARADLNKMGVGMEMALQGRAASISDMGDVQGRYTMLERVSSAASSQSFIINLLTPWTNIAQEVVGSLVVDETVALARKVANGAELSARETTILARSGIDKSTLQAIGRQADLHAEDVNGLTIANIDRWTDKSARDALRRIVTEDVRRVVVEPHAGEVPVIMKHELGSLIFQYKAFGVASVNKLLVPALQHKDMRTLTGVLSMVAAGYMVDQLRYSQSEMANVERPVSAQIGRAIERSGVLGYFTDVGRAMDTLSDNRFGWGAAFGEAPRKQDFVDLFGPAASQARRAANVAGDTLTGNWDRNTARDMRRLFYMNNFAAFDWPMDAMQRAMTP